MLYNCRLGSRARLLLAPFGARGRDAAFTLNPMSGQVRGGLAQQDCAATVQHAADAWAGLLDPGRLQVRCA